MITYRKLTAPEIEPELFSSFNRHQEVTKCWRKIDGEWVIKDIAFTEEWAEKEFAELTRCLKNTVNTNGFVAAAFSDNKLKGFVSVESTPLGSNKQYLELSSIHVSFDMRGNGVGKALFDLAKDFAKQNGAKNCIFRHIPPLKVRLSIKPSAVKKRKNTIKTRSKKSLATASWNVSFK